MTTLHEIHYKAWLVFSDHAAASKGLGQHNVPWHFQAKYPEKKGVHTVQVKWANYEANPSAPGYELFSKVLELLETQNPDESKIVLYDFQGYN